MKTHETHKTRYSDSSLYDEVCTLCGATDGRHDRSLEDPCPNPRFIEAIPISFYTNPEPTPKSNTNPALWDLVISDMKGRDSFGTNKYGTRLQANNGRDALVDAYQEALDLCVYLRQAIFERDGK